MLQEDYFVVESTRDSIALAWDQESNGIGLGKPLGSTDTLNFRLNESSSTEADLKDFHESPEAVISLKLAKLLEADSIYGVELIPAKVRDRKNPFSEEKDFKLLHIWNQISCVDENKSELEYSKSGNTLFGIEELVLDEAKLSKIDLEKRLIFILQESISVCLMHESIVSKIKAEKMQGIRFFKVEDWDSDACFS